MADPRFHDRSSAKTLSDLASIAGAELHSSDSADVTVDDVAPLSHAEEGQISFLDNIKYKSDFIATKATACIVSEKMIQHAPEGVHLLVSKTPYKSYALVAQAFYPEEFPAAQVSEAAHVHPSAKIADGCTIEAGAVVEEGASVGNGSWVASNAIIGKNVELGAKCRVGSNATISHALIGDNVRMYPGVRIGQDGFGFAIDPAGHVKVPQLGRVIIEDNVEIGANTCIDRGAGPDTIIGAGTWIDNLVQVGHNVKIGRGCVLIAQSGVAGSSVLEDYAVVAAQGGVAGHLTVGMGAQVGAQAGVMRDVPAGEKVLGSPAMPVKDAMRQFATLRKLASKD